MNDFGERLKKIRKGRKLSLRQVASASGVSLGQLSDLETGKQPNPQADTLLKLCNFYGIQKGRALELIEKANKAADK
ncbi:MAG: hypothetical protein COA78_07070 [Blastopirellula sp.]|nr:MAG: hypothetical protein COA78_07070 [Blastopirellula sp.]